MSFYEALKASILKVLGEILGGLAFLFITASLLIVYGSILEVHLYE